MNRGRIGRSIPSHGVTPEAGAAAAKRGAATDPGRRAGPRGSMALGGVAVAFEAVSKGIRRFMGGKHLGMLRAAPHGPFGDGSLVDQGKAG